MLRHHIPGLFSPGFNPHLSTTHCSINDPISTQAQSSVTDHLTQQSAHSWPPEPEVAWRPFPCLLDNRDARGGHNYICWKGRGGMQGSRRLINVKSVLKVFHNANLWVVCLRTPGIFFGENQPTLCNVDAHWKDCVQIANQIIKSF